mmetsp:Transcript_8744/g.27527  ORF Transcript_8744/g.27527 Transcript_8744/m.27527 type:complete len:275 (-) Transcript_8744:315-1139(-)
MCAQLFSLALRAQLVAREGLADGQREKLLVGEVREEHRAERRPKLRHGRERRVRLRLACVLWRRERLHLVKQSTKLRVLGLDRVRHGLALPHPWVDMLVLRAVVRDQRRAEARLEPREEVEGLHAPRLGPGARLARRHVAACARLGEPRIRQPRQMEINLDDRAAKRLVRQHVPLLVPIDGVGERARCHDALGTVMRRDADKRRKPRQLGRRAEGGRRALEDDDARTQAKVHADQVARAERGAEREREQHRAEQLRRAAASGGRATCMGPRLLL